jgi:hypothetical protein
MTSPELATSAPAASPAKSRYSDGDRLHLLSRPGVRYRWRYITHGDALLVLTVSGREFVAAGLIAAVDAALDAERGQ